QGGSQKSKVKSQKYYGISFLRILNGCSIYAVLVQHGVNKATISLQPESAKLKLFDFRGSTELRRTSLQY
ncbi:hypothetical protein VB740_15140, partial [Nostoc sp. UHCC 0251]|nr:hypothetical protein [Nostoc sp. UHCC 0251]